MSGFKLIAIRPLKGCNSRFLKSLKEGQLYQFFNNYEFIFDKSDPKIINEIIETRVNYDLYSIERSSNKNLAINISAIVGRNGSGKSTLVELFFAAVYNFSLNRNLLDIEQGKSITKKLIPDLRVQIIYEYDKNIFVLDTSTISTKTSTKNDNEDKAESLEIRILKTDLDFSEAKILHRSFRLDQILENEKEKKEWLFKYFFYTIAVNYSIYGLNSLHIGSWINALFHKNDGYKAPLVINPMRTEGNFDINTENYLAKTRLISNLIHPDFIDNANTLQITEYQKVDKIIFEIDIKQNSEIAFRTPHDVKVTITDFFNWHSGIIDVRQEIDKAFFDNKLDALLQKTKFGGVAFNYIVRKLIKIARQYESYKDCITGIDPPPENYELARHTAYEGFLKFRNLPDYLKLLKEDDSHITFKVKQAINFIKYNPLGAGTGLKLIEKGKYEIDPKTLSKRIKKHYKHEKVVNLIPPSIFNIDFELINTNDKSISRFNQMSSGELQLIHSTQSFAYHLTNLDSVSDKPKTDSRLSYTNLNFILDEIELYFHPDLQRKYIKRLIDAIKRLELKNIDCINILLVTHSPFILSDIPINNIVRIDEKGKVKPNKKTEQTFGTNIHELLADSFFLSDKNFIGEFANEFIVKLINEINKKGDDTRFTQAEAQKLHDQCSIIGEPFIHQKLTEMIIERTEFSEEDRIQKMIEIKEKEIEDLKSKKNSL